MTCRTSVPTPFPSISLGATSGYSRLPHPHHRSQESPTTDYSALPAQQSYRFGDAYPRSIEAAAPDTITFPFHKKFGNRNSQHGRNGCAIEEERGHCVGGYHRILWKADLMAFRGDDVLALFQHARDNGYAVPAINSKLQAHGSKASRTLITSSDLLFYSGCKSRSCQRY